VVFEQVTQAAVQQLWAAGHTEAAWPLLDRDFLAFQRQVEEYEIAAFLGEGLMLTIHEDGNTCGYVTLHQIAKNNLPIHTVAVEVGTYLLPQWRGRGLNRLIKEVSLAMAFSQYAADWCVFVIPTANRKALSAMSNLPWEFYKQQSGEPGLFTSFLKRRTWEVGYPVWVYALSKEQAGSLVAD
jgi:hypothetical protein